MKETYKIGTGQGWTKPKKVVSLVLVIAAVLGTLFLPIMMLDWASAALERPDDVKAAFWTNWSFGLVVLGPSLFTASLLAMASQRANGERWLVRGFAAALTFGIYLRLYELQELQTSIWVGTAGVVYSLIADGLTPGSSGSAADDTKSPASGEPAKAVVEADRPAGTTTSGSTEVRGTAQAAGASESGATAGAVAFKPWSQASVLGLVFALLMASAMSVVALILDLFDLGVRSWAASKSRRK